MDLADAESPPEGFGRREKWPTGRFALSTPMVTLDDDSGERVADQFEESLRGQLLFFERNEAVAGFIGEGRGYLCMLLSVEPKQGSVRLPTDFLVGWGALGGYVDLDVY